MDFFAEKENGKENEETQANDEDENDEDENDEDGCSYQTIRPVAPPSTIEFEERIGGLEESPATVSIQMNTKKNLVVLLKVGSDGYLFRSYLFNAKKKEPLDIKPSGRADFPYQLKMMCDEGRKTRCGLKLLLLIKNKQTTHPDFFIMTNFLIEGHLQKNKQELENHLRRCCNANAFKKTRDFYIKSMVKTNREAEKPLSLTQIRRKISEEAGFTLQESAEFLKTKSELKNN
jgi:hypothetical protein